ncbi:MAG: MFS transporter [Candidatus Omnitrophota bacterium]
MKKASILTIVFFTVFLDLLGFGILIPLLPYVIKHFGASAFQGGLLMASYSIAQFLFAPVWGRLSDRIGRRPVILVSLAGSAAGYLLFAYAHSLAWLFASRLLSGAAAANIATAQSIMADCLPPKERTKGMGLVGAAIGLGFTMGPAVAGIVGLEQHYSLPFLIAAALSGADLLLALLLLPETMIPNERNHSERRRFSLEILKSALNVPFVPRLLTVSLFYYIAFASMESTLGFYVANVFGLTDRQNSALLFAIGAIIVFVQGGVVGRAAKRFGDRLMLSMGIGGVLLGLLCIGLAPTAAMLAAAAFLLAFSSGFVMPCMASMLSQCSAQEVQGGILGLNQSMASMGRILGPLMGTYLFDAWSPSTPFFLGSAFILVSLFLIFPIRSNSTNLVLENQEGN